MIRPLYIFDLDGTIAIAEHRMHHIEKEPPDWSAFFKACTHDIPNEPVIKLMTSLIDDNNDVWIFSGRSDEVRVETQEWLRGNTFFHTQTDAHLQMRKQGDHQPDDRLKLGWYKAMNDHDKKRLVMTFDDRDRMVKMWRDQGVTCLQVTYGNF